MAKKEVIKEVVEVEASTTITESDVCVIVGTGKYKTMPKGKEYEVSKIHANVLIDKGAAELKK